MWLCRVIEAGTHGVTNKFPSTHRHTDTQRHARQPSQAQIPAPPPHLLIATIAQLLQTSSPAPIRMLVRLSCLRGVSRDPARILPRVHCKHSRLSSVLVRVLGKGRGKYLRRHAWHEWAPGVGCNFLVRERLQTAREVLDPRERCIIVTCMRHETSHSWQCGLPDSDFKLSQEDFGC